MYHLPDILRDLIYSYTREDYLSWDDEELLSKIFYSYTSWLEFDLKEIAKDLVENFNLYNKDLIDILDEHVNIKEMIKYERDW